VKVFRLVGHFFSCLLNFVAIDFFIIASCRGLACRVDSRLRITLVGGSVLDFLLHVFFFEEKQVFSLDAMCLKNVIFDLIALNQLINFTAASSTVLKVGHLDLVINLGHFRRVFCHRLESRDALFSLVLNLIPVSVRSQDSVFLRLEEEVCWTHLHTLNERLDLDGQLF
jgi:hypothetical protein